MANFLESVNNSVKNWEYGCTPETLVVLVPGLAQIVQYLQLNQIEPPRKSEDLSSYTGRVDSINTAHAIGGVIRAITWLALSVLLGETLLLLLAIPALYQSFSSTNKLIHQITVGNNGFRYIQ